VVRCALWLERGCAMARMAIRAMLRLMSDVDFTAPKERVIGRPFPRGASGNPAGRPKGARSKLGEQFLQDLATTWKEHGDGALRRCAQEDPAQFCRIVAGLLPKEAVLDVDVSVFHEVSDTLAAFRVASEVLDLDPKRAKTILRQLTIDHDV
jgi:Family of unknown function (DUF5681)